MKETYHVIRTVSNPYLKQLIGVYQSIHKAKFIMGCVSKQKKGKYKIVTRQVK
jgi:hypothetical protein